MNTISVNPAGRSASSTSDSSRRPSRQMQEYIFVDQQATAMRPTKSTSPKNPGSIGVKYAGTNGSHPSAHALKCQHDRSITTNTTSTDFAITPSKKTKYHEAMSRNTQDRFDKELSKAFAAPITAPRSRDVSNNSPRARLAATHPANYSAQVMPNNIYPSPESTSSGKGAPSVQNQSSRPQPTQLQVYAEYNDPMYQTSTTPNSWGNKDRTILKADTNMEYGKVISPTFMIGLPLGSMIEVANVYPASSDDGS